jgi:hypothetical protein
MMPRRFELHRDEDESGISGTGVVAEGIVFDRADIHQIIAELVQMGWLQATTSNLVVIKWRTEKWSVVFWRNLTDAIAVHGHGGKTRFVFQDDEMKPDADG